MSFWGPANKHTVLITGGGSGIGLAFAKRIQALGHTVIITGRRDKVLADYPDVNVLINNAGIQNRLTPLTDPAHGTSLWEQHKQEISTNYEAPIHLAFLFIPHFLTKATSQIVNVTSGLSFVPISAMATYCSTKAALHSYTQSLRQQLLGTSIKVLEIIPPAVNTDLGGKGLHTFGEPLDEYADHVIAKMVESDENTEIGYKFSEMLRTGTNEQRQATFDHLNSLKW